MFEQEFVRKTFFAIYVNSCMSEKIFFTFNLTDFCPKKCFFAFVFWMSGKFFFRPKKVSKKSQKISQKSQKQINKTNHFATQTSP